LSAEPVDFLRKYLTALSPSAARSPKIPRPAITISRESGAGALSVATLVAQELNVECPGDPPCPWTVFDRDLIAKILEDHSLSKRIEEFMPEDSRFPLSESFEFLLGLHPRSGLLREYTKDTIRKLTITGAASLGVHISATSTRPGGDLVDTLAAYFKAGLENKEFCLWLISPLVTEEVVRSALRQTLPEIDRYLLERGMEILPSDVWYREGGVFDLRRALNG
jgi:MEDS: MEthanogen/methylotroph, DcmR Sensory domain